MRTYAREGGNVVIYGPAITDQFRIESGAATNFRSFFPDAIYRRRDGLDRCRKGAASDFFQGTLGIVPKLNIIIILYGLNLATGDS